MRSFWFKINHPLIISNVTRIFKKNFSEYSKHIYKMLVPIHNANGLQFPFIWDFFYISRENFEIAYIISIYKLCHMWFFESVFRLSVGFTTLYDVFCSH